MAMHADMVEWYRQLIALRKSTPELTDGALDLGPWQQIFYCEFDGGRPKRLVIKVMGE